MEKYLLNYLYRYLVLHELRMKENNVTVTRIETNIKIDEAKQFNRKHDHCKQCTAVGEVQTYECKNV